MLIYHPAFDAYHCVFRMLALIESIPELEVDKARLLDFYQVFPSAISDIRLPSGSNGRRLAKALTNAYRNPLNPKAAFRDMAQIQHAALRSIAALGIVDVKSYEQGILQRADERDIPSTLKDNIENYILEHAELIDFLTNELSTIPLRGVNGLKHRSELLEHRYDLP
jgi:hypothetical protein